MFAVVPPRDELADLGVEILDRGKHTAADGLPVDDSEPDIDEVEPGPGRWGEVHVEPGMPCQPGLHCRIHQPPGGIPVSDQSIVLN